MTHDKTKGVLLTLTGGTLWAVSGACGQYLFQYKQVTSNWLVPVRLTLAGLMLLLFLFWRRGKRIFAVWSTPRSSVQILCYGIFGMMLCQYTYFTTIQHSNAAIGTVLQYLAPILILAVECLARHSLPTARQTAALVLAVGGTVILATHGRPGTLAIPRDALLWGLTAAATYAFYTLYSARLLEHFDAALIIGWGMLLGGILLSAVLQPWRTSVLLDRQALAALFVILFFGSVLSFTLYVAGVRYVGASTAGMLAAIEPVASAVLTVVWLHAGFGWMDALGIACILSTVFLLALPAEKHSG